MNVIRVYIIDLHVDAFRFGILVKVTRYPLGGFFV